jgi:hypothetical protein
MTGDFNIEPPKGLFNKIMKRIHREERILVLRRVIVFSITLLASVVGLFPTYGMLASDLSRSGFFRFLSLTFSDFSVVTAYWQSFAMILLQSLPALSLALFLAIILTFLQSIKSLTKDVKLLKTNYGYK